MKLSNFIAKLCLLSLCFLSAQVFGQEVNIQTNNNEQNTLGDIGIYAHPNNPAFFSDRAYLELQTKRYMYDNGFLKIGRSNLQHILGNYEGFCNSTSNGSSYRGTSPTWWKSSISLFNNQNQHQASVELGLCLNTTQNAPIVEITDIDTDEQGNIYAVVWVASNVSQGTVYATLYNNNNNPNIQSSQQLPFVGNNNGNSNQFSNVFILHWNPQRNQFRLQKRNTFFTDNSQTSDPFVSNQIDITSDNRGGFYISENCPSTVNLSIGAVGNGDPNFIINLPSLNPTTRSTDTYIVHYNAQKVPIWAKRYSIEPSSISHSNPFMSSSIDLVADSDGNVYAHSMYDVDADGIEVEWRDSYRNTGNFQVFGNGSTNSRSFTLMRLDGTSANLDWLKTGTNYLQPNESYVNHNRTSTLGISQDRLFLRGEFGNFNGNNETTTNLGNGINLTGTALHNNVMMLGYDLQGNLDWSRNLDNTNARTLDIDTDQEGNAYLLSTYRTSLPCTPLDISTTGTGVAITKYSKCGRPFWSENIFVYNNNPNINLPWLSLSLGYVNTEAIYTTVIPTTHNSTTSMMIRSNTPASAHVPYVIHLKDMPLLKCSGTELIATHTGISTPISWQWFKGCEPIIGANTSTLNVNEEGYYSAVANGQSLISNEIWISTTPVGLDFEIEGASRVCLGEYTYTISNDQSTAGVQYTWELDNMNMTLSASDFAPKIWTTTDAGIRTISVIATTPEGCEFTRQLQVEVFDPAPPLDISPNITICEGDNQNIILNASTLGYDNYVWTSNIGIISNTNQSFITVNPSQLPTGTTTYEVTATMANGNCPNTGTVSITKTAGATLDLHPTSICGNGGTIQLSGGSPAGGTYSGTGVLSDGITFDPSGLTPGTYEIFYTDNTGCGGIATDIIEVKNSRKDYHLQITACANSTEAEVFLSPELSNGDQIQFLGQTYTSGGYWTIPANIGASITATISNNNTTANCDGIYINNSPNTVTVTVAESPARDLYLKDHPFDFGQQPSGGGWNSPSITVTQVAPPISNDAYTSLYPSNTTLNPTTHPNSFIKFYYSDGNPTDFATVEAITDIHQGLLVGGTLNYVYLKIHNKCGAFGEGLGFDALFGRATTTFNPGGWTSFLPVGLTPQIPRNLPDGGELIIVIPVEGNIVGLGNYHTCTLAKITNCVSTCTPETTGFEYRPQAGISGSNNLTWRNINVISSVQGQSAVTIKNDDLVGKMVRVKYNFDAHTPGKAHYLEYNNLSISLPTGLLTRWSANNYSNNNVSFVNGSNSTVKLTEQRDGWMEFWLDAGESHTIGLTFTIPPSNNLSLQDPVYRFHVLQFNEGVQTGGVSYDLMIDFVDAAPTTPSNLQAQVLSSSKIKLTWQDNSNNEQVFVLERRRLGASTYEIIANVNENTPTYTDTGLDHYTTYQYRLRALSSTGLFSPYISTSATTLDVIPEPPTPLEITLNPNGTITLRWQDNTIYEQRYEVRRSFNGSAFSVLTSNLPINSQNYLDLNISGAGVYIYRVRAYSATQASNYAEFTLTINPLQTPDLIATVNLNNTVVLTWNPVTNATSYLLERSENGGIFQSLGQITTTSYNDVNVTTGQTYTYRLTALQGNIQSPSSTATVNLFYTISGTIKNHFNQAPIEHVIVELVVNGSVVADMTTGSDGTYSFFNVLPNTSYTIRPTKNTNPYNGVTNADLNAILGIGNNPYLRIAADVNGDCSLTNADYYMANNFINNNGSVNVPSWQFVSSDYNFSISGICPFEDTRTYLSVNNNHINQDFIGIKTADITGDVDPLHKVSTQIEIKENVFEASPNPFNTSTIIRFSSEIADEKYIMLVRNALGQEIKRFEGVAKKGNNEVEINMLGYSSGLYYVEYISSDRRENIKIVVAK